MTASPNIIRVRVSEAAQDAHDLSLIYSGRQQLASLQLWLILHRLERGLPAGRDSIGHLVALACPTAAEGRL